MRRTMCAAVVLLLAIGCGISPKGPTRTVEELVSLLGTSDPQAQVGAALDLGQLGPQAKEALPALLDALNSPHSQVRQAAAVALGKMGPEAKEAVPALTAALGDPVLGVGCSAANALGAIGAEASSAIPALQEFNKQPAACGAGERAINKIRS